MGRFPFTFLSHLQSRAPVGNGQGTVTKCAPCSPFLGRRLLAAPVIPMLLNRGVDSETQNRDQEAPRWAEGNLDAAGSGGGRK